LVQSQRSRGDGQKLLKRQMKLLLVVDIKTFYKKPESFVSETFHPEIK